MIKEIIQENFPQRKNTIFFEDPMSAQHSEYQTNIKTCSSETLEH